jgi:hypothetical protein
MTVTVQTKRPLDVRWWAHRLIFVVLLAVTVGAFFYRPKKVSIVVPVRDLPAYHVIVAGDLAINSVNASEVKPGLLPATAVTEGHYLLEPVRANQPVTATQVGPAPELRLIQNTLVVELPAAKFAVTGPIGPGDVVSVTALPAPATPGTSQVVVPVLAEALVLNVNRSGPSPSVTLAVPITEWPRFQEKTANATVNLARLVK